VSDRIGVNQPPGGGRVYPFAADGALVAGVLDVYLSYEDAGCALALPFTLTLVTAGGDFLAAVTDALGATVASGNTTDPDARSAAWGDRTVYEWVGSPTVLRLVVRAADLADGQGELDARTHDRLPARVASVRVGAQTFAGQIRLEAGYNVTVEAAEADRVDGGRFVNRITIGGVPGAGLGRVPGCADATVLRRINQVGPSASGNFTLQLEDCYRAQLPVTVSGDGAGRSAAYGVPGCPRTTRGRP
jgi:hypothetical protein